MQYGLVPRIARWAILALWICFVGALVLEASDQGPQLIGALPAAATAYAMGVLSIVSFPKRQLSDLVLVPVCLMAGPELVASAVHHGVEVIRIVAELASVGLALIPAKVDRIIRSTPLDTPSLGSSFGATSGRSQRWTMRDTFDLRRRFFPRQAALPAPTPQVRTIVHRMPDHDHARNSIGNET